MKILIIKSSSRAYSKVKKHLRDKYPEAKIDVLVTSQPDQAVEANPERGEAIEVESGSFDSSSLSDDELRNLREEEYDLCVVLYNNIYEFGYGNVEKLAQEVKPGKIKGMDVYLREWELNFLLFTMRLFKKPAILIIDIFTILFVLIYFIPVMLWRSLKRFASD